MKFFISFIFLISDGFLVSSCHTGHPRPKKTYTELLAEIYESDLNGSSVISKIM